jgi:hypothetical protein
MRKTRVCPEIGHLRPRFTDGGGYRVSNDEVAPLFKHPISYFAPTGVICIFVQKLLI